jgi:hypothetical protein
MRTASRPAFIPAAVRERVGHGRGLSHIRLPICARAVAPEVPFTSAAEPETQLEQEPARLTFEPEALRLEPGELSKVIREPSDCLDDVYKCTGCKDSACQVCCRIIESEQVLGARSSLSVSDNCTGALRMQ